ncbi:hypothetical protein [Brevibacillus migulae]|uniref:hypothetical protein n=1 Tax=Brevibacillus migulae TaxID=1644114 RepID=UPI00106ECD9D|nr:hypothetical protein [Brevibacillus migulae]
MREALVIDLVAKEKTFTCKEAADSLEIGISTLRKWSLLLEQHGHVFLRNAQNGREYRQKDLALLFEIKELCRSQAMPLEVAVANVTNRANRRDLPRREQTALSPLPKPIISSPLEQAQRLEQKMNALAERVSHQEQFNQQLLAKMEQQERYIEASLKERDRRLTRLMSDILETKMYVAQAKEKERKTSIWHRLFSIHW